MSKHAYKKKILYRFLVGGFYCVKVEADRFFERYENTSDSRYFIARARLDVTTRIEVSMQLIFFLTCRPINFLFHSMEHVVCHGRNYSQLNVGNIWLLRVLEGLSCNSSYLSVSTKANAIFRIFDNLRNMDFGEDLTFLMQLSLTHDSDSQFPLFDKHPLVNLSRELTSVCELASLF